MGTCTQGDDGRFYASVLYSIPFVTIALVGILSTQSHTARIMHVVTAGLMFSGVMWFWGPLLWQSTLQGHHLCGAEYNAMFIGEEGMETQVLGRLIPLIHLMVSGGLFWLAVRKLRAKAIS
ncbi:hypothetical protein L4C36_20430 [Photobacterium japonica]|uniref:hypothetical protein n=1 Tax=Photobacterium japonica TaxID=2910235 RepID=UPI003D10B6FC